MRRSYLSSKAEVRGSVLGGRGLFATARIARHELVAFWGSNIITFAELAALPAEIRDYPVQVWYDSWAGPRTVEEVEGVDYMNHSCEPNCGVSGQMAIIARRDIEAGEELTFDYGTTESRGLRFECACLSKGCRGVVTSDDWKAPHFRERNSGYLSSYIEELIRAEGGSPARGLPPGYNTEV